MTMTPALKKRFIITGIILAIIFGGLLAYHIIVGLMIKNYMKNFAPPPVSVNVVTVTQGSWQNSYSTVGNLVAVQGTNISPQVTGTVTKVLFNSGDYVQAGQSLIIMDTGILSAQLAGAIANERLQKVNYVRAASLYRQGVMSQSDFDTARANYQTALAQAENDQQQLNQKILAAPFTGRVGIRQVSLGQYLNAGDVVTNIQQLNPIYANFDVPEQFLSQMHLGQNVEFTVDTFPDHIFKGKITAFNAEVGNDTKAITVQATLPNNNPKMRLLPGMLTKVRVLMAVEQNVLSVPQQAISYTLYGDSVFVVATQPIKADKEDKKAKATTEIIAKTVPIMAGEQVGNQVRIVSGVNAGQEVVINGQVKLQDGSPISIVSGTGS
jgi:membrane fusion protein, multidrug efflux system